MVSRRLWIFFLIFICLGIMLSAMEIKTVHATTIEVTRTFTSQTYDGEIYNFNSNYTTCRNSEMGIPSDEETYFYFGQDWSGILVQYAIYRAFPFFDTIIIPDSANITSCILSLYISTDESDKDFNMTIQNGQPTYPHAPLEDEDYYYSLYSGNGGNRNTSTIIGVGYWNVTLNSVGLGWINKLGTTKFCLRSSRDISAITPTGDEWLELYSIEKGSAYAPKLYVTYETEGYRYIVHGNYYEDGSIAECITNVTLYSKTSDPFSFTINSTDATNVTTLEVEQAGWYFQWNASSSGTRTYYLKEDSSFDEFWLFVSEPDKTYYFYTITFLDLAGVLNTMPYVSVQKYVNGIKTVERQKVDMDKKVVFYLELWAAYSVVLESETSTYTFGDVIFTTTLDIALTLKAVDFPKPTLFTYKYVRVYGERAFGTSSTYTQTRYFRNDEKLGTNQTSPYDSILINAGYASPTTQYLGIRIWIVHANTSTTEITFGTAIAIANGQSSALISATWNCPKTNLTRTDKIRVRVYTDDFTPPTTLQQTFETQVLGSQSLETSTWTVYYYLYRSGVGPYSYSFRYGETTYNSRITGFKWTSFPYGNITITYQDTLNMTDSVDLYINYKNGTNVYNTTFSTDSFVCTWSLTINTIDYAVVLNIDHEQYGEYTWKQYFPRSFSEMPWGMGWFGSLPFNTAYIIPALLIIFFGACFSVINAYIGAFSMVATTITISYLGWLPIPAATLVTAFTFAIIMAIIYAKRRIQT